MQVFTEDKTSPFAQAYYRFIALSSRLEMSIKAALKQYGITHEQLNVLYVLAKHHPLKLHAADIKEHLIVSNPDVTRLIDRLVSKKLVHREVCQDNRRKIDISITDKGLETFQKAHYAGKKATRQFFELDLSDEEVKQLRKIIRKIKL